MAYCFKCGAYIPDLEDKCPACGAARVGAGTGAAAAAQQAPPPKAQAPKTESPGSEYRYSYTYNTNSKDGGGKGTADGGGESGERSAADPGAYAQRMDDDARQNRGLGALCYLGVLLLVPLALRPGSPFIRYHCNQGLLFLILTCLTGACWSIPIVGWIAGLVGSALSVVCFLKGIISAASGKCEPLPLIGGITLIK